MLPVLKVVALGGACAGALYCTWWMSNGNTEIPFRDLSTDSDFKTSTSSDLYHNKYAADYAKYFVGVSETSSDTYKGPKIDNKSWWKWAFENRYKNSQDKKQGFKDKDSADKLKDACKAAYQKEANKVKASAGNDEFEESNVWTFCSIGGNKPKSISEVSSETSTYGDSNYGGKSEYSGILISVEDKDSSWFWDIKEKELLEMQTYPTTLEDSNSNSKFKQLHASDHKNKDFTKRKVRELCKEAYKTSETSNTDFPKKVVFKFCSLKGQEPSK